MPECFFRGSGANHENFEIVDGVFKNLEAGKAIHIQGLKKAFPWNNGFLF